MIPAMRERPPKRKVRPSGVEEQIRKAQPEGLFDDLPGQGTPLEDLDEVYDPGWWAAKLDVDSIVERWRCAKT